jgi:hypothetical protein
MGAFCGEKYRSGRWNLAWDKAGEMDVACDGRQAEGS